MLQLHIFLSFLFYCVQGGELLIAKTPQSIKFQGDDPIDQHLLPEIFSAAMGFTTQQDSDWNGLVVTDPFSFIKAVAVLFVDGVPTLGKSSNFKKYVVNNDEDELSTWRKLKNKVLDRFPLENNTMVMTTLGLREELGNLELQYLDKNTEEDVKFLYEISELNKYIEDREKAPKSMVPDLYWFSLKSLHQLSDLKGSNDASTFEAKEKVSESLVKLGEAFESIYRGRALVVALVSDASHTRRIRSTGDEKFKYLDASKDNIYDPDFPIMFNIILWFTVVLFFSLLAVSVFIASMDPGRDSIIYRMTSNRMKKDS